MSALGISNADVTLILRNNLHASILEIACYFFYTAVYLCTIYVITTHSMHWQSHYHIHTDSSLGSWKDNIRPRIGHVALLTLMWIIFTFRMSLGWYYIDNIYIRHGATQGDELEESCPKNASQLWLDHVAVVLTQINVLLAEGVMVRLL